jgi:hypothetical protein
MVRARHEALPSTHTHGPQEAEGLVTNLEALDLAARAATPGPWEVSESNGTISSTAYGLGSTVAFAVNINEEFSRIDIDPPDAHFIALANPATVLSLVSEIRTLRAGLGEALELLQIAEFHWTDAHYAREAELRKLVGQ